MIGAAKPGVIWVCGLAGTGKTTFADALSERLQATITNVTRIDGDVFRKKHCPSAGYTRDERLQVAQAIVAHAWSRARAGDTCVVSTISLFTLIHAANANNSIESGLPLAIVLIEAPEAMRFARRTDLYLDERHSVVGREITPEYPMETTHRFANDGSIQTLREHAELVAEHWQTLRA